MSPFPSPLDPIPNEQVIYEQVESAEQYLADSLTEMFEDVWGAADVAYALFDKALAEIKKGINVKVGMAEKKLRGALADMAMPNDDISAERIRQLLRLQAMPEQPPTGQVGPPLMCAVEPGMGYVRCMELNPGRPECCESTPDAPDNPPPPPPPPPEPPGNPPCPPGQIYDTRVGLCVPIKPKPPTPPKPPEEPEEPECCPQQIIQIQCPEPPKPPEVPTIGCCPKEPECCTDENGNEVCTPGVECPDVQDLACCPELSPCAPQSVTFNPPWPLSPPGNENIYAPCGQAELLRHYAPSLPSNEFMKGNPVNLSLYAFSNGATGFDDTDTTYNSADLARIGGYSE